MIRSLIVLAAILTPAVAFAQEPAAATPVIQVTGTGVVQTPPDLATIEMWIRGEGATSAAATDALAAKQAAILGGLRGLLGAGADVTTTNITVIQVRDRSCDANRGYGAPPQLSQGACAVTGYVASMQGSVRTRAVDKAGTAAGLASRLGASDARLQGFALSDPNAASRRATAAAITDARGRAEAAAIGANVRLGPLVAIRDQNGFNPMPVYARSLLRVAPEPPAPEQVTVIPISARPIETRSQVLVSYGIAP